MTKKNNAYLRSVDSKSNLEKPHLRDKRPLKDQTLTKADKDHNHATEVIRKYGPSKSMKAKFLEPQSIK